MDNPRLLWVYEANSCLKLTRIRTFQCIHDSLRKKWMNERCTLDIQYFTACGCTNLLNIDVNVDNLHSHSKKLIKFQIFLVIIPRGVHCTKHVQVYVSAQKGY